MAIEEVFRKLLAQTKGTVFFAPTIRTPREFANRISRRFPMASATPRGIARTGLELHDLRPPSACNAATKLGDATRACPAKQ
jgi:hypothetical protein